MLKKIKNMFAAQTPRSEHPTPLEAFHSDHYLRHTARRLEHLASMGITVAGKTVFDAASGVGDHAQYYLDRGCTVTLSDVRDENLAVLRDRFPKCPGYQVDFEEPGELPGGPYQIVHCYGLLYHLGKPEVALTRLSQACSEMLFLETCVTPGDVDDIYGVKENPGNPTWAFSGNACRPSRRWIVDRLKALFPHVYLTKTQPNHPQFPIDWTNLRPDEKVLTRAVFVASRQPLDHPVLTTEIPVHQEYHA